MTGVTAAAAPALPSSGSSKVSSGSAAGADLSGARASSANAISGNGAGAGSGASSTSLVVTSLSGVGASCGGTGGTGPAGTTAGVAGAGRFSTDSRPPGSSTSTARIAACNAAGSASTRPGAGQPVHPLPEVVAAGSIIAQDRRGDRPLLLEQPVVDLLDVVGDSPSSISPTIRPLPFSVWKARRIVAQRLAVALVAGEHRMVLADRVDHLVGLGEIDLHEFAVELRRSVASSRWVSARRSPAPARTSRPSP